MMDRIKWWSRYGPIFDILMVWFLYSPRIGLENFVFFYNGLFTIKHWRTYGIRNWWTKGYFTWAFFWRLQQQREKNFGNWLSNEYEFYLQDAQWKRKPEILSESPGKWNEYEQIRRRNRMKMKSKPTRTSGSYVVANAGTWKKICPEKKSEKKN